MIAIAPLRRKDQADDLGLDTYVPDVLFDVHQQFRESALCPVLTVTIQTTAGRGSDMTSRPDGGSFGREKDQVSITRKVCPAAISKASTETV